MLGKLFNHADLLEKSLDASWLKMEINAQNIANADTPGYDAKRVEFEDEFLRAMAGQRDDFVNYRTNEKHYDFREPGPKDPRDVEPVVVSDDYYVMRMDDNNVDIDREMNDMAKNTIQYNALVQKISKEFAMLKTAIKGS